MFVPVPGHLDEAEGAIAAYHTQWKSWLRMEKIFSWLDVNLFRPWPEADGAIPEEILDSDGCKYRK